MNNHQMSTCGWSLRDLRPLPVSLLAVAAAALTLCVPALAGEKKWVAVHEGGFVTSIAIDPTEPNRVYAATARGLFASADGGETWRPLSHGLAGHFVGTLAVEPGRSGALYVGTNEGGILRGGLGGKRWTRLDSELGSTFISAIAFDPAPGTLYLGTNRGVYRSTDGGAHFEKRSQGLTNSFVSCLAVDSGAAAIYAGTNSGGVFKSSDRGEKWKEASAGLASGVVWSLVIDPGPPSILYAATYDGIFRTTDGGSSWVSISGGPPSRFVMSLAIDPRSTTMYAGTAGGLFKSVDGGARWAPADDGLTNGFVNVLAMRPESPRTIYAGTNGGVFKTTDGAAKWTAVRLVKPDAPGARAPRIAVAPSRTSESPSLPVSQSPSPLLIPSSVPPADSSAPALNPDPEVPTTAGPPSQEAAEDAPKPIAAEEGIGLISALIADPRPPGLLHAATPHGIYSSATAGESWSRAGGPIAEVSVSTLVADATVPGRLYAGTDGAGVFQSGDGGVSWTPWNAGLDNLAVTAIAVVSPRVYAATDGGVFLHREAEGSWEAINSGLTDRAITALAAPTGEPAELYAATQSGKVFHTKDGGASWSETAQGPWKRTVRSLVLAGSPPALWVATDRGIFRSDNGGGSWSASNSGLTTLQVSALQPDPADAATLYAVTANGVFRCANGGGWTALARESGSAVFSIAPAAGLLYAGGDGAVWKSADGGKSWKSLSLSRVEPPSDSPNSPKPKAERAPALPPGRKTEGR
jgi:photosystem II stability/assembly factor-like uncharacterized protein